MRRYHSRWALLTKTTPSGKSLWVCTVCGRQSIAPDKRCPTFEVYIEGRICSGQRCDEIERDMKHPRWMSPTTTEQANADDE